MAVVGPYKVGYVGARRASTRAATASSPCRELEESGTLKAAFDEKQFLSLHDRAYARFSGAARVKRGEQYAAVPHRARRPHPVTGELFGYQSRSRRGPGRGGGREGGHGRVIAQAYDPIERGTCSRHSQKVVRQVQRRPNQRALAGIIVAARAGDRLRDRRAPHGVRRQGPRRRRGGGKRLHGRARRRPVARSTPARSARRPLPARRGRRVRSSWWTPSRTRPRRSSSAACASSPSASGWRCACRRRRTARWLGRPPSGPPAST